MNKTTEITTVSHDNLQRIVGGIFGAGSNRDTSWDVLGGVGAEYKSKSRSNDAYLTDALRDSCRQANTSTERTWYGGSRKVVNEQAAHDCFTKALNPAPATAP